jgi:hypothetical protein
MARVGPHQSFFCKNIFKKFPWDVFAAYYYTLKVDISCLLQLFIFLMLSNKA